MPKISQAPVAVLVQIVEDGYGIIGVFAQHDLAVAHADANQIKGWHVIERPFYALIPDRKQ